jgi:DNA-binding ferritin-like protein
MKSYLDKLKDINDPRINSVVLKYTKASEIKVNEQDALVGLASLHALSMYMQHAHWVSKSEPYYGDHLLFQRLYEDISDDIDEYAEKFVGLIGHSFISPVKTSATANEILSKCVDFSNSSSGTRLFSDAEKLETLFVGMITSMYKELKTSDNLTLGLDDYLMSLCSKHENNLYLIKQRVEAAEKQA